MKETKIVNMGGQNGDHDAIKIAALENAVEVYRDELKAKDVELKRLRDLVKTLQKAIAMSGRAVPTPTMVALNASE